MKQMFKDFKEFLGILFIGSLIFTFLAVVFFWFGGCCAIYDVMGTKKYFDVEGTKIDVDSIYTFFKLSAFGFLITCIYLSKISWYLLNLFTAFLLTRRILKHYKLRYYISHPDPEDVEVSSKED